VDVVSGDEVGAGAVRVVDDLEVLGGPGIGVRKGERGRLPELDVPESIDEVIDDLDALE
jgi:hypothetical protein